MIGSFHTSHLVVNLLTMSVEAHHEHSHESMMLKLAAIDCRETILEAQTTGKEVIWSASEVGWGKSVVQKRRFHSEAIEAFIFLRRQEGEISRGIVKILTFNTL